MPATWPGTLPQSPIHGWSERKLPNVVDSDTDAGPSKRRRRFTAAVRRITLSVWLTLDQRATLEGFHTATLSDGSLPFDWVHPATGTSHSFRWMNEFAAVEVAEGLYRATLELEYVA